MNTKSPRTSQDKLYRFAYARITVIVLLALLCAGILISVTNDLYAFVKADTEATLTVDAPQSLRETARQLKELGILQNPTLFRWYVESKGMRERMEAFSGRVTVSASMSYRELLLAFSAASSGENEK